MKGRTVQFLFEGTAPNARTGSEARWATVVYKQRVTLSLRTQLDEKLGRRLVVRTPKAQEAGNVIRSHQFVS
jgi:hypothetical protein